MGKRKTRRKNKRKNKVESNSPAVLIGYHQYPFALFHSDLERQGYDPLPHHEVAISFWNIVPPGNYDSSSARPIIEQYRNVLEGRLAEILGRHSIAYWLHAYRRLFPGPIGGNKSEATIHLVRGIFEAAVHKYAMHSACSGIGDTTQIDPSAIFNGLLMEPQFTALRTELQKTRQIVLTDFGVTHLKELYETERIAYQLWRCGAALRITGKGAGISVDPRHAGGFFDTRSYELNELVESYDSRGTILNASASGTAFNSKRVKPQGKGIVLLATYNVYSVPGSEFAAWFKLFGIDVTHYRSNFLWAPFNLLEYCKAHQPFSDAFREKHGIPLPWVFAVLGGLMLRVVLPSETGHLN